MEAYKQTRRFPPFGSVFWMSSETASLQVLLDWMSLRPAFEQAVKAGAIAVVAAYPFRGTGLLPSPLFAVVAAARGEAPTQMAYELDINPLHPQWKPRGPLVEVSPRHVVSWLGDLWPSTT